MSRIRANLALFPRALWLSLVQNRRQLFTDWVTVPLAVLGMLVFVWAVNLGVSRLPFSFPASVAAMIIAFLVLLLSSVTLGRQRTSIPLRYLEPASDFLLKWISMFFCPSFILLPVEEANIAIGGLEIVKIILFFLISFVVFVVLAWSIVKLLQFISPFKSRQEEGSEEDDPIADAIEDEQAGLGEAYELSERNQPALEEAGMATPKSPLEQNHHLEESQVSSTTNVSALPRPPKAAAIRQHHGVPSSSTFSGQPPDLTIDEAALESPLSLSRVGSVYDLQRVERESGWATPTTPHLPGSSTPMSAPAGYSRTGSQTTLVRPASPPSNGARKETPPPLRPYAVPLSPEEQLAALLTPWLPTMAYILLFLIGLPIFYTTSQSLPLFLALNVLAFLFSVLLVPPRIRRFLHPIITCSVLTVLSIWGLGAIKGWGIQQSLGQYSTGSRYLVLFDPSRRGKVAPPGAGDVLYSVLDASIVSLAVPMYRYRGELKRHAFEMFSTTIPLAVLSMFIYPLIGRAIQLSPSRGLAFAARSVTTPMAIPMEATLQGDPGLTVVLCILTGVLGAMAGPTLLRWLRVKDEDFITIGIVLGCTASAISTAALLGSNPRAAAISSLAFVIYGVACIILSAVPPVVEIVQTLAGL